MLERILDLQSQHELGDEELIKILSNFIEDNGLEEECVAELKSTAVKWGEEEEPEEDENEKSYEHDFGGEQ